MEFNTGEEIRTVRSSCWYITNNSSNLNEGNTFVKLMQLNKIIIIVYCHIRIVSMFSVERSKEMTMF